MSVDASRIGEGLAAVRARIAAAARAHERDASAIALVAVSKNQPASAVRAAFAAGQRDFGENRVQELVAKAAELGELAGLRWHLIGSLQTNKARAALRVPGLVLLHSVDRSRLADELQVEAAAAQRRLDVLLQLHVTGEATKHGCAPAAAAALALHVRDQCPALRLCGVMAMGPVAGDSAAAFARAVAVRDEVAAATVLPLPIASLGMSSDLEAAVAAGSTLVRAGTAIFGARD